MSETQNQTFRILIADDELSIVTLYQRILDSDKYQKFSQSKEMADKLFGSDASSPPPPPPTLELTTCRQSDEAVEKVHQSLSRKKPYAVAFLDVRMPPGPNGVWAAEQIRKIDKNIQIVMVTGYSDIDPATIVSRVPPRDKILYVQKPFQPQEIRHFAASLCDKWLKEKNNDVYLSQLVLSRYNATLKLACMVESKYPDIENHLERVRKYTMILAKQLATESPYQDKIDNKVLTDLYSACLLHDIGKIKCHTATPEDYHTEPPVELDFERQHTITGPSFIKQKDTNTRDTFLLMACDIAVGHHEQFNGQGYPYGLRGQEIPLTARIVSLADAYEEMTAPMASAPVSHERAIGALVQESGKKFDPAIIEALRQNADQFRQVLQEQPVLQNA
ncbi:MAG: HD domain-containing protein [Sedimentisphaerales bacterium]|nr:HD domain-containing protein [Sedimentisphaerales bacterium]